MKFEVRPHPSLRLVAFTATFPGPVSGFETPPSVQELLRHDAPAPVERAESTRAAVRDLLRHGGYKPTGRGKPASEYLVRASEQEKLQSINLAVDVGNVVSLHSGLPISVVDAARLCEPLSVHIAGAGESFVFNAGGQEISVEGLLCLHDADGPCANAVKDAQRTKTSEATTSTLSLVWGCAEVEPLVNATSVWYRDLLKRLHVETALVHS